MELFYVRNAASDGEAETFNRPDAKKTLMLHYIFVTALLLEDCEMAPAQVGPSAEILLNTCLMMALFISMSSLQYDTTPTTEVVHLCAWHVAMLFEGATLPAGHAVGGLLTL